MVGGYYNNGCTCGGGGTATTAIYDYGGTSATASDTCGCCHAYSYATLTSFPSATEEEIIVEGKPQRWDIVRTVLYAILRLQHYIEKVARPPPNHMIYRMFSLPLQPTNKSLHITYA